MGYMKACNFAFLYRASSRATGRHTGSGRHEKRVCVYALRRLCRRRAYTGDGAELGGILVGFGRVVYSFMPHVGKADVGHNRREKAKEIKRRVVLPSYFLKLFAYFSSIPLVRYAGVGDSHKTELILSCAAFLQCPTPALPTSGIKGEKRPKGLGSG